MKNTWYSTEGSPSPLGCTYIPEEDAYNFALYSKNAENVRLLFYNLKSLDIPILEKELDFNFNKSQRICHCRIKKDELKESVYYAYQISGQRGIDNEPDYWQRFDSDKILLDPYAKEVFFPPEFSVEAACKQGSNAGKAPLGYIHYNPTEFDWQNEKKTSYQEDLIIYELHVRGFTMMDETIFPVEKRGTYAGIIEKIPYLSALGITAVELMPVHQFDASNNSYWGYNTLNFFAPHQNYAYNKEPGGAITEFKTLVRELHRAGIEVILDVVFNHTTEGDINGPTYSFKGIDNSTYYLLNNNNTNPYSNFSGTGNTMRTDHPVVQRLIVDSLLFWIKEMHIDGFRFDLASIFSITSEPTKSLPPHFFLSFS